MNLLRRFATVALVALVLASLAVPNAHADPITIEWSTVVSSTGNAADPLTGYGSVDREYRIGKYEVTIGQYTQFLNAVDPSGTNPYSLYNNSMGTDGNIRGILFSSGSASGQKYSPIGSPNRPITYVSWFDAARFANWMQNGQGTGSTETGAYTLNGATSGDAPARNEGAQFYIPTENEWYKAAYFSPVLNSGSGGYYTYATQSNTAPGNTIGSGLNQANYNNGVYSVTQSAIFSLSQNYLTDVGAFTNSASSYGTFDQAGNVWEWNDLTGTAGPSRGLRGGYWGDNAVPLSSSFGGTYDPLLEGIVIGIRLASPVAVPEPTVCASLIAGLVCGTAMWRRRKRV
jgi:formylglycine-generating enzyme